MRSLDGGSGGVVSWAQKQSTLSLSDQHEQGLCLYALSTVLGILKEEFDCFKILIESNGSGALLKPVHRTKE